LNTVTQAASSEPSSAYTESPPAHTEGLRINSTERLDLGLGCKNLTFAFVKDDIHKLNVF
jgi:hypothetical protein